MSNIDNIYGLLKRHYDEAAEGLVDKAPSRLLRGEGTEKNYYILKIDLVGSTGMLLGRKKGTYLKLAHTFLSSIDQITQDFGADPEQTEYAGDSVLAYFPESDATAESVISAACYSRAAVQGILRLDATLHSLPLKCKVVLHYDTLIVSKIGPRANSFITAIGYPLHRVAKLEKEIEADTGRATKKFFQKVTMQNRKFLTPIYKENPLPASVLISTLFTPSPPPEPLSNTLLALLYPKSPPPPSPTPLYTIEKELIGYNLRWPLLFRELKLTPA